MSMSSNWSDSISIVDLSDEPAFSDDVAALIDKLTAAEPARVPHVVLNFGNVTYVNSSNLAQLLRLRKRLVECSKILKICSVTDEVWSVFQVTGLDKVFRFAPDPGTALASLQIEDTKPRR
ncbi:MAG: STAS domain-containing protein [Planctomycetota bacterium]|nr:STAS domain-containing protein [Planctomycetota bacterium]